MRLIWATRGRTWGFRFLRTGEYEDPLGVYETVFSQLDDQPEVWGRVDDMVALRFPDPDERQDASGRVIPHEFVVFGPEAGCIDSLDDGRRLVWREVAQRFEDVWDRPETPPALG